MDAKLLFSALTKFLGGVVLLALLLFVPAGNICYEGAWRLMLILFVPMLVLGVMLLVFAPELLRKRLSSREKRSTQSRVVKLSGLVFVASFVVAGLDYRFGWSDVGRTMEIVAMITFLIGYALYWEVMRENEWLSRTVEVSEGQRVVQTGLYGIVRHPMYLATLLMFLSMPLVLGSWWSFGLMLLYLPVIVARTIDEERLLCKELKGYEEYCQRIRWRIFPFVW